MALKLQSLVLQASVPHTPDVVPVNFYCYATPDAVATVIAAGYFNNARSKLNVNDVIDALCVATGTGDRVSVIVTAVPASGNVTVAVNTDATGV